MSSFKRVKFWHMQNINSWFQAWKKMGKKGHMTLNLNSNGKPKNMEPLATALMAPEGALVAGLRTDSVEKVSVQVV